MSEIETTELSSTELYMIRSIKRTQDKRKDTLEIRAQIKELEDQKVLSLPEFLAREAKIKELLGVLAGL
jgi:hypothetical protein